MVALVSVGRLSTAALAAITIQYRFGVLREHRGGLGRELHLIGHVLGYLKHVFCTLLGNGRVKFFVLGSVTILLYNYRFFRIGLGRVRNQI